MRPSRIFRIIFLDIYIYLDFYWNWSHMKKQFIKSSVVIKTINYQNVMVFTGIAAAAEVAKGWQTYEPHLPDNFTCTTPGWNPMLSWYPERIKCENFEKLKWSKRILSPCIIILLLSWLSAFYIMRALSAYE